VQFTQLSVFISIYLFPISYLQISHFNLFLNFLPGRSIFSISNTFRPFSATVPATDGQYKVQVYEQQESTELYIANVGRFSVEDYIGWDYIDHLSSQGKNPAPNLSHSQVQTLLGKIGENKGFDIWIPRSDRSRLDWNLVPAFSCTPSLPPALDPVVEVAEQIDVMWIDRGKNRLAALFEVEHSTPIYSGLLRLNDVLLSTPQMNPKIGIASNDERKENFVRQLNRPTFKVSGLTNACTFFEYENIFNWHNRIARKIRGDYAYES